MKNYYTIIDSWWIFSIEEGNFHKSLKVLTNKLKIDNAACLYCPYERKYSKALLSVCSIHKFKTDLWEIKNLDKLSPILNPYYFKKQSYNPTLFKNLNFIIKGQIKLPCEFCDMLAFCAFKQQKKRVWEKRCLLSKMTISLDVSNDDNKNFESNMEDNLNKFGYKFINPLEISIYKTKAYLSSLDFSLIKEDLYD